MIRMNRLVAAVAVAGLVVASCGSDDDDGAAAPEPDDTSAPADPAAPGSTPGTAPAGGTVDEIVIGSLAPLTGPNADYGEQWMNGIHMAVDEINAAGGIASLGGAQIRVIEADHTGNADVGQSETSRLIDQGAVAIIGALESGVTLVSTQVSEQAGIPYLVPLSVTDQIMERGYKYVFRTMEGSELATQRAAEHLVAMFDAAGLDLGKVAIMHNDAVLGVDLAEGLESALTDVGIEVLNVQYPETATDVTTEVARVKDFDPDVVALNTYYTDGQLVLRTMQQQDVDVDVIYGVRSGPLLDPETLTDLGCMAEYAMDSDNGLDANNPEALAIAETYEAQFGRPLTPLSMDPYMTLRFVLADALERAGSTDPDEIRDALADTDLEVPKPGTPVVFDETGQNINAEPVTFQWIDGTLETVWPASAGTADFVLPVPSIEERCSDQ